MHQTFDARLDLDECAVIGDVGNLAEHAAVGRVTTGDVVPRIFAQLLQAEADAVTLAIELQHAHVQLVADVDDFGRMAHALPGHVGDVQQAVDTAQVHECAVVGQVLDDTLQDRAFLQLVHQLLALFRVLAFDHCTTRNHHVIALAVQLDQLELEFLAFQVGRVAHRAHIHQRTRQERADILMSTVKPP